VELGERLGLLDFEAGAKVTGHGFYFLKNDAVLLELALQRSCPYGTCPPALAGESDRCVAVIRRSGSGVTVRPPHL
jgi:hypothetical protein